MTTLPITSAKLTLPFKAGELPRIDPNDPKLILILGGVSIVAQVSAKAARKAGIWAGPAVLQGKLVFQDGRLAILDCGFAFIEPPATKPEAEGATPAPTSA
ncbi:MAG: hypothetical protein JO252_19335 [Planctomycetaceae bacterium]|nr:hypothetical protein [Planctomycetaceae bacterium]